MSNKIKVVPTADEHVGIAHPFDGPVEPAGSDWTHDTFTERLLQAMAIRRVEIAAAPAKAPTKDRAAS